MKFANNHHLKPIIEGAIGARDSKMLIDTGADYVVLNVPKYQIKCDGHGKAIRDINGQYAKERLYTDVEYDNLIRENYGAFVKTPSGDFVKTTVHGFGDITNECRLIILNNFSIENYEFTDSYVLLDENGFARNQDMILGTACLRNFEISLNYEEKSVEFKQITKDLQVNYLNILSNDSKMINGGICLPTDIYLHDD